jgi:hypothetical protein
MLGKELQSYNPIQLGVLGFVDHTHPTLAQFFKDFVMRDRFVNHLILSPIAFKLIP